VPDDRIVLRDQLTGSGSVCRTILDALPAWFGIPESVDDYEADAEHHPTVIASLKGAEVGFTTVRRHSPFAAEVTVMGILPEHHRHGVGRTRGYRRTRAFLPGLWVPSPRGAPDAVGTGQSVPLNDQAGTRRESPLAPARLERHTPFVKCVSWPGRLLKQRFQSN
jgi:hypothetical protein